jgi:hypothetical protein
MVKPFAAVFLCLAAGLQAQSLYPYPIPYQPSVAPAPKIVEVYSPTPGLPPFHVSQLYTIEVEGSPGVWHASQVYAHTRKSVVDGYWANVYPWVHWTTIGIEQETKVRVTRLPGWWASGPISSVSIEPKRYGIVPSWTPGGNTIEFTVRKNQSVFVDVNGTSINTLFLFAKPPKPRLPELEVLTSAPQTLPAPPVYLPSASAPTIIYFPPGMHWLGLDYQLPSTTRTVYLDGGSWVQGTINVSHVNGPLEIVGPGVLSGEAWTWENTKNLPYDQAFPYFLITTRYNSSFVQPLTVKGPTFLVSPLFNFGGQFLNGKNRIEDLSIISPWTWNTDGIGLFGSPTTISNCFVFNGDNSLFGEANKFYGAYEVSDCVLAGRSPINVGYGYSTSSAVWDTRMTGIDVILKDAQQPGAPFEGVFFANPNMRVERQYYSGIRVNGDVIRLFDLAMEHPTWVTPSQYPLGGRVLKLHFENISYTGPTYPTITPGVPTPTVPANRKCRIVSLDSQNYIEVVFTNLTINGTKVTNANASTYFSISPTSVVTFR